MTVDDLGAADRTFVGLGKLGHEPMPAEPVVRR